MRTSPAGPAVMCASPLPVINSRVMGPLTVNWRSKSPSTPECEVQPAITKAVRTENDSDEILCVRVIEFDLAAVIASAAQSFLSSYTKTRNWKFLECERSGRQW